MASTQEKTEGVCILANHRPWDGTFTCPINQEYIWKLVFKMLPSKFPSWEGLACLPQAGGGFSAGARDLKGYNLRLFRHW